ncbi:hypothetical protein [Streptomyces thermolilacinus]|uniref:Uncharacterized protein n=1 Tax=Streptomyces thermolilacinus SPC6 TaxID=1306406 RepID=A0A1D3DWX2_9ACTN|nr:hypothetical protein [Streptomyces thermolilacinus]OEJ96822.1 hypothetical protein J116_022580 [Streptomyces thermolilacinus SPC6]
MPARTPTRPRATAPAAATAPARAGAVATAPAASTAAVGADARLPWWAIALPAAAFTALFLLLPAPGHPRATDGEPAVGRFLEHVRHTIAS